jgi:hypothetical protein
VSSADERKLSRLAGIGIKIGAMVTDGQFTGRVLEVEPDAVKVKDAEGKVFWLDLYRIGGGLRMKANDSVLPVPAEDAMKGMSSALVTTYRNCPIYKLPSNSNYKYVVERSSSDIWRGGSIQACKEAVDKYWTQEDRPKAKDSVLPV